MGAIFDELGQALLILGAPGAGKTTLLLELTRDLLDRAEQDASYPMPVVFHLSSWAVRRRPLADWLVDELAERYYVPRKLAQAWIDAEQVLPLLDGLDEVAPEHRAACVEAINTFRQPAWTGSAGRVLPCGGLPGAAGARGVVRGGRHRTALAGAGQHLPETGWEAAGRGADGAAGRRNAVGAAGHAADAQHRRPGVSRAVGGGGAGDRIAGGAAGASVCRIIPNACSSAGPKSPSTRGSRPSAGWLGWPDL